METKRIVITGGPGSGKTSLIDAFKEEGHPILPEISREVTKKAQEEGIAQLFLESPILFSEKLLEGRLQQFHQAKEYPPPFLFYDRGLPDVTAYMDYLGTDYPNKFTDTCTENRYDAIFLLPPWEDIYQQDNERYESFQQAEIIFKYLHKGYQSFGYEVYHVPVGSIRYRCDFILQKLAKHF